MKTNTQDDQKKKAEDPIVDPVVSAPVTNIDEVTEWKTKYLRALADYNNLERRVANSRLEERQFAAEQILRKLVSVLDTLRLASEHVKDPGVVLAQKEFWQVLVEQGVTSIEVLGRDFDPNEMECIEVVHGEENKVIAETRPGYKLHDKVLRVAQVKVGKKALVN